MPDDAELVGRVRRGDTAAYGELVARYERSARVVALRVLSDHHAAEDAVQDAFVAAYRHLGSLRDGSKFGPWLKRIARHEAIRAARNRRAARLIEWNGEPAACPPAAPLSEEQQRLILWIDRLPANERLVVIRFHLDGLRTSQIAQMTGRPIGTVTKQLSRAMRRLRRWARSEGLCHERTKLVGRTNSSTEGGY